MRREVKKRVVSILSALCLTVSYFSAVRASECEKGQSGKALLPSNLILSKQEQPLVERIWRRSPTFRLQCERLSQAQWLKVKLSLAVRSAPTERYLGRTFVNKREGVARIEIYTVEDYVQMVGHELEHVLEQIEGVDIATLAAEGGDLARRHADGSFETARALKAGRKVQAEYISAKDPAEAKCSTPAMTGMAGAGRP